MAKIGRKLLLSQLESVFHEYVENNGNIIRYPITFSDNSSLRGNYILRVDPSSEDIFFSGRYKFGANSLYIYQAIDALIEKLEDFNLIDFYELEELEDKLEKEYNKKYK